MQAKDEVSSQLSGVSQTNARLGTELEAKQAECSKALQRISTLQKKNDEVQSKLLRQSQKSQQQQQVLKESVTVKDKAFQVGNTFACNSEAVQQQHYLP